MVAASVPFEPSRALRATRRLHRGLLLGAVLTAVAVAGSYNLYQTRPVVDRSVVVATHDIPRGAILAADDFTTRSTPMDDRLYAALLQPGRQADLVGRVAPEELHAGLPIGAAQLAPREDVAPDQTVASLPVPPNTVPLQKGDWIQIWSSPKNSDHTVLVLDRVQVLEVRTAGSARTAGGAGPDRAPQIVAVDLALQSEQAQLLLEARHAGDVDVTRLPATAVQVPSPDSPSPAGAARSQ